MTEVVSALSESANDVRVLCSESEMNRGGFDISGARVEPKLLTESFPTPWKISPSRFAKTINALEEVSAWADRLYLHGDALYPRYALQGKPIVRAVHDLVYAEAMISMFALSAKLTIVPSLYMKACIETVVSQKEKVVVIKNGTTVPADPVPRPPSGVAPRSKGDIVLLFPHRPEPTKGFAEALCIAERLAGLKPHRRVRLLAAYFPDINSYDRLNLTAAVMYSTAAKVAPSVTLEIFEWLLPEDMPGCYAFSDVVLCPGSFVESFGLVPIESVAVGTPAVVSKVGAYRTLSDVPGVHLFSYCDVAVAARIIAECLDCRDDTTGMRSFIELNFSKADMLSRYIEAITGPIPPKPEERSPRLIMSPDSIPSRVVLVPWCFSEAGRIWDDYAGRWRKEFPALAKVASHETRDDGFEKALLPPNELAQAVTFSMLAHPAEQNQPN